jgi:HAD superfamily hydrolase (TIGR01662 family)
MGYNAAGKSTFVKSFTDQGYIRVNRDLAGTSLEECATRAGNVIRNFNKPVVLDNTYPSVKSRASIIRAAQEAKVPIRCVHLTTSLEDAQLNACLRMMKKLGTIPNPEDVKGYSKDPNVFPPAAIYHYRKQFEKPTLAEGFSQILNEAFVRVWGPEYVNKAVICDYDGTLRICTDGAKFPVTPNQIKILPNRLETLRRYHKDGYNIFGASNQSGVAKGDLTAEEAHVCFQHTNRLLGDLVTKYLFCPHRVPPITCYCRKPAPGMGAYLIEKYKLLPSKCIMVGDMGGDKSFAARCGFQYMDAEEFFKQQV